MQIYEDKNENTNSSKNMISNSGNVSEFDTIPIIFVTGASRSGTTMLARMLGAHSTIFTFRELHYFGDLVEAQATESKLSNIRAVNLAAILVARSLRGVYCNQPNADERRIGKKIIDRLNSDGMTPREIFAEVMHQATDAHHKMIACEQTGRNIFYAERLLAIYPTAKVVNIVRDPRAVLSSQKNRWKMRQLGANHLPRREMLRAWVNYHPFTIAKLWIRATRQAIRLSNHPRFLTIRFEDLTADPEYRTRKLCEFLNLAFESPMIDIPLWGSSNLFHNGEKKGISKEVTEKWRENLSISEVMVCEKMTKDLMQYFNYKPEQSKKTGMIKTIPFLLSFPFHALAVMVVNPRRAWIQVKALAKVRHL